MKPGVDVREATHVKVNGRLLKIASTWGINEKGHLAPPSQGGFGVVTDTGERISMWEADLYLKDDQELK